MKGTNPFLSCRSLYRGLPVSIYGHHSPHNRPSTKVFKKEWMWSVCAGRGPAQNIRRGHRTELGGGLFNKKGGWAGPQPRQIITILSTIKSASFGRCGGLVSIGGPPRWWWWWQRIVTIVFIIIIVVIIEEQSRLFCVDSRSKTFRTILALYRIGTKN